MISPVRTAFVGGGMVADVHYAAIDQSKRIECVGIYDPDPEVSTRRRDQWGREIYGSLEDVFTDPRLDAVHVLSPSDTHVELAVAAMRAGKHVFVEKPVADIAGISQLRSVAHDTGRVCMPGHNYAYQPEYQRVRRLLQDPTHPLGTVRAMWITYCIRHPESVAERYRGVLDEVMVHHSYLTVGLLGRPTAVLAGKDGSGWTQHPEEDQAWMVWKYGATLSAHLFASFAVDDPTSMSSMFSLKILGTNGGASYHWSDATFRRAIGSLTFGIPAYEETYGLENDAFATACRGDRDAIVSPLDDALVAAEIATIAQHSVMSGAFAHVQDES